MATTRTATAQWRGALLNGAGTVSLDSSNVGTFDISWPSRAEQANGRTSPEELIAAAHASCYSMALAHGLAQAGTPVSSMETKADVTWEPGSGITGIALKVRTHVPDLDESDFQVAVKNAKENCPVSQALAAVKNITVDAELLS